MTFKNFVCKGILVFAGLLLLGWIGKYLSGILGMAALCVIVGGIFGCVIAAWLGIRAVWYMVGFPISKIVVIHKRTC